jgi:hypothetical protein
VTAAGGCPTVPFRPHHATAAGNWCDWVWLPTAHDCALSDATRRRGVVRCTVDAGAITRSADRPANRTTGSRWPLTTRSGDDRVGLEAESILRLCSADRFIYRM